MAQNEDTMYFGNNTLNDSESGRVSKNSKSTLRDNMAAGAAGAVFGAAAMYAKDAFAGTGENKPNDDSVNTASASVAPEEKQEQEAQAKTTDAHESDVSVASSQNAAAQPHVEYHVHYEMSGAGRPVSADVGMHSESATDVHAVSNNEPDVKFIDSGEVQLADGSSVTVAAYNVGGHLANVYDIDQDGTPDVAVVDINDNRQVDEGEVIDMHTGQVLSFGDDQSGNSYADNTVDDSTDPTLQTASYDISDSTDDASDYSVPDSGLVTI